MSDVLPSTEDRLVRVTSEWCIESIEPLGHGIDGNVWRTSRQSALKVFARRDTYERERDCYRRLFENRVVRLSGFHVPELLDYSNAHCAVEMTIVKPPCILDFGKAYVDSPPSYTAEALSEAEAAERELFTEKQWRQVRLVRAALLRYGIHYFDARPSNIMFPKPFHSPAPSTSSSPSH
jgi:hypothetical protein